MFRILNNNNLQNWIKYKINYFKVSLMNNLQHIIMEIAHIYDRDFWNKFAWDYKKFVV